jgi:RNA polymerase sigma-70 factor, ECF subfamily
MSGIVFSAGWAGQCGLTRAARWVYCEPPFAEFPWPPETPTTTEPSAISTPQRDPHVPDQGAFSALYEAHASRVYRYLLARTSDPAEAEELTSHTFLNALARLEQYRGRGAGFPSWVMSIAHNLLVNWYRDRGRRPPTEARDAALEVPAAGPGPDAGLEQNEIIATVRQAVSALPADRQQLIAFKYVDGRANAEIGRIMGRSEGAIKALHHRTLRELQRILEAEGLLAHVVDDAPVERRRRA